MDGRRVIPCWKPGITPEKERDIAYQERNLLALRYADGWYYDVVNLHSDWSRVLTLDDGKMSFHIPDDFPVGTLLKIEPNWDGHSTKEKWKQVLAIRGIDTKEV